MLHKSRWAAYNRKMGEWWREFGEWVRKAPARKLRAILYNRRVQRTKVAQGSAKGWSEFKRMVWAMTIDMGSVRRSKVYRRLLLDVNGVVSERLAERARQQRWREQQFDWDYHCWQMREAEGLRQERQKQEAQKNEVRERKYREATQWVLACEERSSTVDFTACCTFVPKDGKWGEFKRLATTFDTLSQINGIVEACVLDSWEWLDRHSNVSGIGGKSMAVLGTVLVPGWALAMGGQMQDVECVVFKSMPQHMEMLIGLPVIRKRGDRMVVDQFRVHTLGSQENARLDWLWKVLRRMNGPIENHLALCSGILPQLVVMYSLGFNIGKVYAVEQDSVVRRVAEALWACVEHIAPHTMEGVDWSAFDWSIIASIIGGPPCTPWSSRSGCAQGFGDPVSKVFIAVARVMVMAHKENPAIKRILENVMVDHSLIADMATQEGYVEGEMWVLNSLEAGGAANRVRRYFAPEATREGALTAPHLNPQWLCEFNWRFLGFNVPCLVAAIDTENQVLVTNRYKKVKAASCDVRDRLNPGEVAGITTGWGQLAITDAERHSMTGNAFSNDAIWGIIRQWDLPVQCAPVCLVAEKRQSWSAAQQLGYYGGLPREQVRMELTEMGKDLVMPKLRLKDMLGRQHTVPFQTDAPGFVNKKLAVSADYMLAQMIKAGSHKLVEYEKKFWVALLFVQQKKGRTVIAEFDGPTWKTGDVLFALRPLHDRRALNSATAAGMPVYWVKFAPRLSECVMGPTAETKVFCVHDSSNAYHSVMLDEESKELCVSKIRLSTGEVQYIQAVGGDQGLAAMALFFPIWSRYGYCHFFGMAFEELWREFVDDTLCWGEGKNFAEAKEQAELKMFMLSIVKRMMGLEVSPKQDINVYKEVEFCGLWWSAMGICVGEKGVAYILSVLDQDPAGVKQARMLRGVLVQGRAAFEFTLAELNEFSRLMKPITEAIRRAEVDKVWEWTSSCKDSTVAYRVKLKDHKRHYTNPDRVVTKENCLCMLGDADPAAVEVGLWCVQRADANDVEVADLETYGMAWLLGIHPKSLNGSQQSWHISEKELFVPVVGVRFFGNYITHCINRWFMRHPEEQVSWVRGQMVPDVAKICIGSDSETALGSLLNIRIPEGKLEFLTAKIGRHQGYAEEMACTLYWPLARLRVHGEGGECCNSLSDFICRQIGEYKRRLNVQTNEDLDWEMTPWSLPITFQLGKPSDSTSDRGVPAGFEERTLMLSDAQWDKVMEAYVTDDSEYGGLMIKDIYAVAVGTFTGSGTVRDDVQALLGKMFFLLSVGDSSNKAVLYTPRTALRDVCGGAIDATRELVLVVPKGAEVRVSKLKIGEDEMYDRDMPDWAQFDMRRDILWCAHEGMHPHAKQATTVKRALTLGWWPSLEVMAKTHYRQCAHCEPLRLSIQVVGMGSKSSVRNAVVQFDDKPVPKELRAACGYVSVLTIVEITTGDTMYLPRKTEGAAEVALLFQTRWIPRKGLMQVLQSDNATELVGEVIQTLCAIHGIPRHIQSSVGDHCSHVERANAVIALCMRAAAKMGDVRNEADFLLYVGKAEIFQTQIQVTDGSTVFERNNGVKPITAGDLMILSDARDPERVKQLIAGMKEDDAELMQSIANRCEELIEEHLIGADKRARYNAAHRMKKEEARTVTDFGISVGDTVSYLGKRWLVQGADEVRKGEPAKLQLKRLDGSTVVKSVATYLVRPMATQRPQNLLPREQAAVLGEMVLFQTEEAGHFAIGKITAVEGDKLTVHEFEPRKGVGTTFLPLWIKGRRRERKADKPAGFTAEEVEVALTRLVCSVELDGNCKLTEASDNYVQTLGFTL